MFPFGRCALAGLAVAVTASAAPPSHPDLLQFAAAPTSGIQRENVAQLQATWQVPIPEQSDGAPLFVTGVPTGGTTRDLLIVETNQGRVVALDPKNGQTLWQTTPPAGVRWTTSTPAVDPQKQFVYAYCLDGYIHKYAIGDGRESSGNNWPQLVTTKTEVEKGSSAIRIATAANGHTYLYMPTAAYPDPGDAGDYQGHVTTIDLGQGTQNVFNAACSDKLFHLLESFDEHDCEQQQSGIWARAGVIYDPSLDRIFATVGNGVYDAASGGFNWGSSVVAMRPDGSTDGGVPLDSYTPDEYQMLTDQDLDLSASAIEILPTETSSRYPHLGVQIGKDGVLRLLNLADLSGYGEPRHVGGELTKLQGLPWVLTRPVALRNPDNATTSIYVTNSQAMLAFDVVEHADKTMEFVQKWSFSNGGTSPVLANGILFYATEHQLYGVDSLTGQLLWQNNLIGAVHWETPIVAGSSLFICDGDHQVWRFDVPDPASRVAHPRISKKP